MTRTRRKRDRLVTTWALADHLRVEPDTIRRWVRLGRIPVYRVGQKVLRFSLDDVIGALRCDPKAVRP